MCVLSAIASGDTRTLVNILDNPNQYINGISLLGYAILANQPETIDVLTTAGANPLAPVWEEAPSAKWADHNRPLLLAATRTNPNLAITLACRNFAAIFIGSIGSNGVNAMMVAAYMRRTTTVQSLYALGADPTLKDNAGHGLLHYVYDRPLRDDIEGWLWAHPRKLPTISPPRQGKPRRRKVIDPQQIPLF